MHHLQLEHTQMDMKHASCPSHTHAPGGLHGRADPDFA